jgi:hypothetical protein
MSNAFCDLIIPVTMIIGTGLGETGKGSISGCHLEGSNMVVHLTILHGNGRVELDKKLGFSTLQCKLLQL